jgi:trans-aconitate methyltransferase
LPLQTAGAGAQRGDGETRRIVDVQRQTLQLGRGAGELAKLLLADLPHAQILGTDS